jgi:uncharacterized protein YndB with AHSA1/START domain
MKSHNAEKVSIDIEASAEKVWEALTTPSIIKKYFFNTNAESDFAEGSYIRFYGEWEGKSYEDKGRILKVDKPRLLKHTYWSSNAGMEDKPENYVDITYKLEEKNGRTTLSVIQENIPDDAMREHARKNWGIVLNNLKALLEAENIKA